MDNKPAKKTPCPVCAFNAIETAPGLALDARLLFSNDPPAFTDTLTLKTNLLDLRRTLSRVTCNISQAEAEVARMQAQRDDLHSAIQNIETVLHPVRSLPRDILVTIFKWCIPLPDDPIVVDDEAYDSVGPMNPLWTLSSVCHRWRDVILSSSHMWSFICLPILDYEEIAQASVLFRLGLQIQRSGNVELDVALFGTAGDLTTHASFLQLHCILPLLLTTTSRWHSINITGFYSTFDSFMGCPFDKLTRLKVAV